MANLKVLYVFFYGSGKIDSGVEKKIVSQVTAMKAAGAEVDLISVNPYIEKDAIVNDFYRIYALDKPLVYNSHFYTLRSRKRIFEKIDFLLTDLYLKYDRIFLRYPLSDYNLLKLVLRYGEKIIIEHNSMEEVELKSMYHEMRKKTKFHFSPGFLFWYFDRIMYLFFSEKLFGKRVLSKVRGGVAVTNEICAYEKKRVKSYRCEVGTNGIDYLSVPIRKFDKKDFKRNPIRGFLLSGFTASWHGVERIVDGLESYKGKQDFELYFIGDFSAEQKEHIEKSAVLNRVKLIAHTTADKLTALLEVCDFAFGTMALHKKNLTEAVPLKVRESLARGFPLVKAYADPDLDDKVELKPFILNFPDDESSVDFNIIADFISKLNETDELANKIRMESSKYIDVKLKADKLLHLIMSI